MNSVSRGENSLNSPGITVNPEYMAPELISDLDETYSFPIDVYSYSILLYKMFSNQIKFEKKKN